MEIKTNELNKNKNISTGRVSTMKLDEGSQAMVFQMFTGGLYSDPIGTVIREITSNCFDSHIEAGVDSKKVPVIVRLGKDVSGDYISFIDKGMGMSPDRVTNIYGTYFKSTKRATNDQIGGFGLGGKTPLAYTESFYVTTISSKENEVDYCRKSIEDAYTELNQVTKKVKALKSEKNSNISLDEKDIITNEISVLEEKKVTLEKDVDYFLERLDKSNKITTTNIKYVYDVFEDTQQPAIDLMKLEGTDEEFGTEVRVPVRESDIHEFEKKTLRQLYYFENVIFEGFNNYVTNDYKILKGKNFLFRGNDYDSRIHVCYGKVAYPLDYEAMNLEQYEYGLPIAIKLEIGELEDTGVTPSRESLKYSRENVKIIKKKIADAIEELKSLLLKQNENVQTLEDYFKVRENIAILHLDDDNVVNLSRVIDTSELKLPKFKYSDLKIPLENDLFDQLYTVNIYGAKPSKSIWSSNRGWSKKFSEIGKFPNIYYNDGEFNRNVKKQGYLRYISPTDNFYIVTPYMFNGDYMEARFLENLGIAKINHSRLSTRPTEDDFTVEYLIPKKKAIKLSNDLRKDFHVLVAKKSNAKYDDVEVSEDYLNYRKNFKISKHVLEDGIPLKCHADKWGGRAERVKFEKLVNFKGKIYYGFMNDSHAMSHARNVLNTFKCGQHLTTVNTLSKHDKGILLIGISKANEKYMKMLGRKAIHVSKFYHTFISRKLDMIKQSQYVDKVEIVYENEVSSVLKKIDIMQHVSDSIAESIRNIADYLKTANSSIYSRISKSEMERIFKFKLSNDIKIEDSKVAKDVKKMIEVSKKSSMKLRWLDMPYYIEPNEPSHQELISLLKMMIDE